MDKMTKTCPLCGGEIAAIAKKCKHCRRIISRECPFCCESISIDAQRCEHCHEELGANPAVPSSAAPGATSSGSQSPPPVLVATAAVPPSSAPAMEKMAEAPAVPVPASRTTEMPPVRFSLAATCDRLKGREHIGFAYDNQKILKWLALTNAAIVLSVLVVTGLCGGRPLHDRTIWVWTGICVAVGLAAPFISLALSKYLAKMAHDIRTVSRETAQSEEERSLVALVENLAVRAGLPNSPEVGIYKSADMNAFATGMGKGSSLVAFSTALLEKLDGDGVSAVAAHEIAHVANGDMITMAMVQAAVNALVLLFSMPIRLYRLFVVHVASDKDDWISHLLVNVLQFAIVTVLLFLGNLVVKAFSRHREFIADRQAACLTAPSSMIRALRALGGQVVSFPAAQQEYAAFKICSPSALLDILSTHPAIERRIEALEKMATTPAESPAPPSTGRPA